MAERDRIAEDPGGCECEQCDTIFIGAVWHYLCGMCHLTKAMEIIDDA